ncbi:hypothetical protein D9756_008937 [Leucocoprinus leucothites]|uniref:Glycoside hydrolase family 5 protein n=1 Tax=Leucocoprinus leucothites TaxID=201217 RepID=A0A8H5FTT5_9AGAR|nr:hypothetical protein D9756_008937 [Leucoagaricus leucothites]
MSTHEPIHPQALHTAQFSFIDAKGRKIHLRGVNLSGSSKAPLNQPSHVLKEFWDVAESGGESLIGQPLNIEDGSADEHLARLRGWGFNLLRFPVTWEALEHAGPKKYDYEFMDYIVRVLVKCKQYGFRVYMDPHQDTWSRFSGGSGAPFWTLPACGINPYNLSSTHAALIHSEWPLPHTSDPASFPAMIWGTNYGRLLSLTLFTLFFAGRAFAPNCIIDGINIQDYLQNHYIASFGELADRIKRADEEEGLELRDACVIGWDSLNEPAEGFVEWDDLNKNPTQQTTTLKKGTYPTPAQSLRLGMGQTQTVETWDFGTFGPKRTGTATIDPKGRKIWAEPEEMSPSGLMGELPDGTHPRWGWKRDVSKWPLGTCIWALHGVWDVQSGFILRPDYFKFHPSTGIEVHFLTDFWLPHFAAYTARIRQSHPHEIAFVQPPVFALPPRVEEELLNGRCAYTGHYYDGLTLITKHWNWFNADSLGVLRGRYRSPIQAVKFGEKAIRKSIMEQIRMLKSDAELITAPPPTSSSSSSLLAPPDNPPKPNQYPTIIGEIGTPFDMDSKRSYFPSSPRKNKYRGDYTSQEKALDASLNACDGMNNVGYTVWTYLGVGGSVAGAKDSATRHTHEWGDGWNGEDLSLWSADDLRRWWFDDDDVAFKENIEAKNSRLRKSKSLPRPKQSLRSESQAGLLASRSSPNLPSGGSRNVSVLTLNTMGSSSPRIPGRDAGELDSPVLLTPSASTPTLLGFGGVGLAKKPSVAFSIHTSADDPPPVGATDTTTTAVSASDKDKDSSTSTNSSSSSTLLNHTSRGQQEAEEDPYDFLTDGARAVRAFCRPRPVKVWGETVKTEFEIRKAEFKCVIRTSAAGVEAVPQGGEEEDEELATEIFLPLVHFASNRLLELSKAKWDPDAAKQRLVESKKQSMKGVETMQTPKVYGIEGIDTDESEGGEEREKRFLETIEDNPNLLDVEVRVSAGKYKIRGQTLYWWYPKGTEGEGEEVTIEVKRRGGAIKVHRGGWIDVPSSSSSSSRTQMGGKTGDEEKSWCERLCGCDFGCVIM